MVYPMTAIVFKNSEGGALFMTGATGNFMIIREQGIVEKFFAQFKSFYR